MDLPWGSNESFKFVTNVGLITSTGPYSDNIMAAEWTHHVSYSPGLILVGIGPNKATTENIKKTKEFGVNLAAYEQNIISSVSGNYSGRNADKISTLKELGFKFYKGKKIKALMVEGASLNCECRLVETINIGDHILFIGEVVDKKVNDKESLIYHRGKYWKLGEDIPKPEEKEIEKIRKIVEKYGK